MLGQISLNAHCAMLDHDVTKPPGPKARKLQRVDARIGL